MQNEIGNAPNIIGNFSPDPVLMILPRKPSIKMVDFEYVIEGKKLKGKCEVLELDLGAGVMMELVKIKKGKFMMGSPKEEKSRSAIIEDQKEIEIKADFWMGRYEITQAQYKAIMGENPSHFKGDKLPVEKVSWNDATKFCEKLSEQVKRKFTLPTEVQWEYACRAGTTTPFHFGSMLNGDMANCNGNYPYGTEKKGTFLQKTSDVGSYPANPWGLHDMHGNVSEWRVDIHPFNDGEVYRWNRGGSWSSPPADYCRAASRDNYAQSKFRFLLGFRVCSPVD